MIIPLLINASTYRAFTLCILFFKTSKWSLRALLHNFNDIILSLSLHQAIFYCPNITNSYIYLFDCHKLALGS